ncbi:ABC transporter permease [Acuticoccus kandeliae]|uniref:ABC transporter permease n=1 Tax=Acuticoccus kandeliae TaxID=2073160 RepID=UPI000D3E9BEE|nr:ABC transporter permease [Acuticoccus kandeliae]
MDAAMILDLLGSAIRIATPLMFAGLGGIISERAGVFAVGLEGMLLCGAFGAVAVSAILPDTMLGPVAAVLASAIAGALLAYIIAIVTVRFGADNMVTGLSANLLAVGLTSFLFRALFGRGGAPVVYVDLLRPIPIPILSDIPGLGPLLFTQPPLTYLCLFVAIPLTIVLMRTQLGLRLRAVGDNPMAAYAAGFDPVATRIGAVVVCGLIAGIGGAVLTLQQVGTFNDDMVSGRGYLALAAIIVGRWKPFPMLAACLMFGLAEALQLRIQIYGVPVSSYIIQMTPYLLALLVLVTMGRSSRMPGAIGTIFTREAK